MSETLFLDIIERRIPADIVYETDSVLGFRDINGQAPEHVLFIPKKHIRTINDLTEADAPLVGELFLAAKAYAAQIGVAEDGFRVVMNCNAAAGQTVWHIHLHFLAGRPLTWPPG
ncbi:MAG: histidine triad nucleotide-binding protein [Pseudomonadota bacterium]